MTFVRSYWPLGALVIAFTLALFALSPGFFTIDEFIYFAGADAFANSRSFVVPNGPGDWHSEQLQLQLLVPGPSGLTPQYPPGTAILGGPLMSLFGLHGLMLVNTLSAATTVYLLYAIAKRHFGGHEVGLVSCALLLGGTFFLEYAFAVWPHAVSVLCVTWAFALALDAIKSDNSLIFRSVAAGAVIGFGLLFRTDTILVLPAVGLVLFLFADRPYLRSAWVGVGFLPFLAGASAANWVKFGTFNPLSYGRENAGSVGIADHLPALLGLALAGAVFLALHFSWSKIRRKDLVFWGIASIALALAVIAHDFTLRYLHGFWGLVVDATVLQDGRPGVTYLDNGTVAFWGLWKKALGQSMPWLALSFGLVWGARDVDSRIKLSILILAVIWSLPFFPKDWHGGMSSNMRYFLPLLPWLCALAAKLIVEIVGTVSDPVRKLVIGAVLALLAQQLWLVFSATHFAGVNQILSTYVFGVIGLLAILAGFAAKHKSKARSALLIALGGALTLSIQLAIFDFLNGQTIRERSNAMSEKYSRLPDQALAYVPTTHLLGWALAPGHVVASPESLVSAPSERNDTFDYDLIRQAHDDGYRVFVARNYVTDGLRNREGLQLIETDIGLEGQTLFEIRAR